MKKMIFPAIFAAWLAVSLTSCALLTNALNGSVLKVPVAPKDTITVTGAAVDSLIKHP